MLAYNALHRVSMGINLCPWLSRLQQVSQQYKNASNWFTELAGPCCDYGFTHTKAAVIQTLKNFPWRLVQNM